MNVLEKYYVLPQLIDAKIEEIRRLRELSVSITSADPSREFVQGGSQVQCRFADIINRIIDLENELNDDVIELLDCELEAKRFIDTVRDPIVRVFLHYYYIDRLNMEQIAHKMNYSIRQLYRIKSKSRHLMSQENAI